jgi:poly-gamma-glutamate capsule biosynthesis protein CapA/YwtB (metallophosphatase superfamily)
VPLAVAAAALAAAALAAGGSPAAAGARAHPRKPKPGRAVTLEWVGDMALSTERGLPPGGVATAAAPLKRQLQNADITAGNLEGTLSTGGASKCGGGDTSTCFAFQAPPSYAGQYRALGFDIVNQANNHAFDYGASGHQQTVNALTKAGLAYTGSPGQITYLRVHHTRVAFVGFAPYSWASNLLDIPGAKALVRRARKHADLVVVFIHAGAEGANQTHTPHGSEFFLGEDRGDPRAFAHAVIDAGASIVLGSGPHVIRGVERYRGRVIAYSLGNFIGYHTLGTGGVLSESAILRVTLAQNGHVTAGDWIPVTLGSDGLPRRDRSDASAHLVARLSREDFPHDHWNIGPHGTFRL